MTLKLRHGACLVCLLQTVGTSVGARAICGAEHSDDNKPLVPPKQMWKVTCPICLDIIENNIGRGSAPNTYVTRCLKNHSMVYNADPRSPVANTPF